MAVGSLAVALALVGCDARAPSPPPSAPSPLPAGAASAQATPSVQLTAAPRTDVLLWLDPAFEPDAAPRLQAALDGWRAAHPDARLEIAFRPTRGPTSVGTFLDALLGVATARLPGVAMVPLDAVPALRERGLATPLDGAAFADRVARAFPFASRPAVDADGTVWALPIASDLAHLAGAGGGPSAWEIGAPGERVMAPAPAPDPGALALALAAFAAADGQLGALDQPDGAALAVAFGALETARAGGRIRVADAPLPLGPLLAADGALSAVATAGGLLHRAALKDAEAAAAAAAVLADGTWGPLPGIDEPAPPIAWGWALIAPPSDAAPRELVVDLLERLSRPDENDWPIEVGHLPAQPDALQAVLANPVLPAGVDAYGAFLVEQLGDAEAIAMPEGGWERWRAAAAALAQGAGTTAAVAELEPDR